MKIRNIQSVQEFKNFLGENPEIKCVAWKGIRVNRCFSCNEITYQFKQCIPQHPSEAVKAEIRGVLKTIQILNLQSFKSLSCKSKISKIALAVAKLRQEVENGWLKFTTGFNR